MIVSFRAKDPIQDENWSPRRIASLIAKRQSSGEDAKCLIAPVPIEVKSEDGSDQSYTATRHPSSKRPPKNFVKANRYALREQQRMNKNAEIEDKRMEEKKKTKIEQKKQQRFGNIKSRVCAPCSSTTIRSQAQYAAPQSCPLHVESDSDAKNNHQFHIAFGRKVPSSRSSVRVNENEGQSGDEKVFVRHKSFGKTPAYITNRRAKIEREEYERMLVQQNAPPAPGLVLMDEFERLETLRILEENEKTQRERLRSIPFAMNGHRAARIREAIEFHLKEIEDAKKIFSKDRVFVAQSVT